MDSLLIVSILMMATTALSEITSEGALQNIVIPNGHQMAVSIGNVSINSNDTAEVTLLKTTASPVITVMKPCKDIVKEESTNSAVANPASKLIGWEPLLIIAVPLMLILSALLFARFSKCVKRCHVKCFEPQTDADADADAAAAAAAATASLRLSEVEDAHRNQREA